MANSLEAKRRARMEQLLITDRRYWDDGLTVAGMDEVGRGPLAGPVVTACVSIRPDAVIPGVDDSKKLTESRREALAPQLEAIADFIGIGLVSPERIDEINILQATREAMEQAARGWRGGILLIDAVSGLNTDCRTESIIHGDATSYMIAAASIVAKVRRDRMMREYDELYPGYGFAHNKGYGTSEHIEAIRRLGPCPIHRRSFIGKWI